MLRKIIVASALGLAFFTSFHYGNVSSAGSSSSATIKVGVVPQAKACICSPLDNFCEPSC